MRGKGRRVRSDAAIARFVKGATKGVGYAPLQVLEKPDGTLVADFTPVLGAAGPDDDDRKAAEAMEHLRHEIEKL